MPTPEQPYSTSPRRLDVDIQPAIPVDSGKTPRRPLGIPLSPGAPVEWTPYQERGVKNETEALTALGTFSAILDQMSETLALTGTSREFPTEPIREAAVTIINSLQFLDSSRSTTNTLTNTLSLFTTNLEAAGAVAITDQVLTELRAALQAFIENWQTLTGKTVPLPARTLDFRDGTGKLIHIDPLEDVPGKFMWKKAASAPMAPQSQPVGAAASTSQTSVPPTFATAPLPSDLIKNWRP